MNPLSLFRRGRVRPALRVVVAGRAVSGLVPPVAGRP